MEKDRNAARGSDGACAVNRSCDRLRLDVAVFALLAAGCSLHAAAPGGLAYRAGAQIPPAELRIRVRSQVNPYIAAIEQAADRVALQCGSPR